MPVSHSRGLLNVSQLYLKPYFFTEKTFPLASNRVNLATHATDANAFTGSYISYVKEEDFLNNPQKYINNAFDKSENDASGYDLTVTNN